MNLSFLNALKGIMPEHREQDSFVERQPIETEEDRILRKLKAEGHVHLVYDAVMDRFTDADEHDDVEGVHYDVHMLFANEQISFPTLVAIPVGSQYDSRMMLESNNCEDENQKQQIISADDCLRRNANMTKENPCTLVIPLIPGKKGDATYAQQLSEEAIRQYNPPLDVQVCSVIDRAGELIQKTTGKDVDSKIVLNGYSSSGVFAQRFALLHPERVSAVISGGAKDCVPSLNTGLKYPLGIGDIDSYTGKPFDLDSYKNIRFFYYESEHEYEMTTMERLTEDGKPAPMHDMTYMERSVGADGGRLYRQVYGEKASDRFVNCKKELEENDIVISDITIENCAHCQHHRKDYPGVFAIARTWDFLKSSYRNALDNGKQQETVSVEKSADTQKKKDRALPEIDWSSSLEKEDMSLG